MTTRFIVTSDLHQSIGKWRDLVRRVEQEQPRFVLIAGDLLPKDGGLAGTRPRPETLKKGSLAKLLS